MEEILAKLLVPNSATVFEGTKELKEAFKNPEAIPALCNVVVTSSNPQIRQSAAVLLRRKLGKRRHWTKLKPDLRAKVKQGMLEALVQEQEKPVKNSIAQFVGILGKHEFADNNWPDLLNFVNNLCSSESVADREMGMYTLSIMTEMSHGTYINHADSFIMLFSKTLGSLHDSNSNLAYYTVLTMKNLVPIISGHQQLINVYHQFLPRVLEVINAFASTDDKKACELFEILEDLVEFAITVIAPHVKIIVEMCLQIGSNQSIETNVQIKAISVVGWIIRSKGKVVQKNRLVEPIIDVLVNLMAQKPVDEGNEVYFLGDPEEYTSITVATQTLDLIALHIPPEKVVPYLLTKVEPAIQGGDIYAQKAAYLALAVLAEGCADHIKTKYLEAFLKCVGTAIHNPNAVVRNAALFALGQFAEHLQPQISKYASELLPVLFECLAQILQQMQVEKKDPPSLDRLFYALETFCENLEDELLPYLPTLMDRLFLALDPSGFSMQLKRVTLSALGSAAAAVKEGILPYFPKIIEVLNIYINSDPNSDLHQIQCNAIETLAVVAQFVGAENFKPLAAESLQLGLRILEKTEDPDVKKSVYALFAALAIVMKEELAPVLPKIVNDMIESIQSSEGIVTHYKDEDAEGVDVYGELSSDDEADEEDIDGSSTASEDSGQCRYTVENSYNDEKEQACLALREICLNTGNAFLPYIEKSFEEIFKLVNYPQDDIRTASIEALLQFLVTLHKVNTQESQHALQKGLSLFIPKCSELIRTDEERSVVISCLEAYTTLLDELKGQVFVGEGHREAIMNCVVDVFMLKTMCQDTDVGNQAEANEDDFEAEHDEILLESAGDVIPKYAAAINPDEFALYFPNVLKLMTDRTVKRNSVAQRALALGTLAECMKPLDVYVEKFVPQLLRLFLNGAKDSAEQVRNNAIYGVGEMVLHGKDRIFKFYNEILQALSQSVAKEAHEGTLDNICGALAKMIIANHNSIPMDQVFPAFIQKLPLREDFQENEAVIQCFALLYQQGHPLLKQYLGDVIKVAVHVYYKEQLPEKSEDTKHILVEFIKTLNRDFPQDFAHSVSSLGPEATESIHKLLIL